MKKLIRRIKRLLQRIFKRFASTSEQTSPLINSRPLETSIPSVSPRWESGLVLVCSQCTNEQSGSTASEDLENWLKSRLKFEGLWGEFRVVSTSCLGICPKVGITVVVVSNGNGGNSPCLIVNPRSDVYDGLRLRELLYSYIKQNKK
ncbi:(2Fe-2S) ferredoxin domain-containing protein [Nostoc sp. UCD121]|uniref:(2Fe-2S) ferredoxin domain-containing protein n=1 Tax=unclassified Nostoc TaxID=2593658 RepID=UPI001629A8C4|nr:MULTISPECIES: (2Fe-2S) ferredoxin domain-containing protein [unclassified Nostoc]MBC1224318.1 (2Fe-2S) ferredoxin domain-containing protein [Nostoc sp. UCD120]MBC1275812.1 (2Fe-2S) ferredoxin domain-containing protein [Nostoc sp. UCD121]MBC1295544.1 (2Fe-2S) ferredoxin domain-containing protein [Nostoc sp. UCD122]